MIHDDFLALAETLARLEPGKPKQSSLRRAVSTAYYAVFHSVAFLCADSLISWRRPWHFVTPIYRSLDHRKAKTVLQNVAQNPSIWGSEAALIGGTFVLLQERRHTADYDPEPFPFGRRETLALVELAGKAVQASRALPADHALLLAAHLIGKERK